MILDNFSHFVLIFIDSLNHPRFSNHYSNYNANETSYQSLVEAYSESCQLSMIESFAKMVIGFQLLTIFAKRSILRA